MGNWLPALPSRAMLGPPAQRQCFLGKARRRRRPMMNYATRVLHLRGARGARRFASLLKPLSRGGGWGRRADGASWRVEEYAPDGLGYTQDP